MAAHNNGVRDIVLAHETLSELVARGYSVSVATEMVAFGVYLRRADGDVELFAADVDYIAERLPARSYLEQVAPEELER